MGLEKFMYGHVSPDNEDGGLNELAAKRASKLIQKDSVDNQEKLFQAELSAEKKQYLLEEKQAKIKELQQRLALVESSAGETKQQLKNGITEEVKLHLEEIQGLKDEDFIRTKNKLQAILEHVEKM